MHWRCYVNSVQVRPDIHDYYLLMLELVASRSTCLRRAVAAIITDSSGHVLSTGYNGVPKNFDHCEIDNPCLGAHDPPGDTSNCMAVHAEINAIMQCADLERAQIMYCSCLPCFTCAKAIANTNIAVVICKHDYADRRGFDVLMDAGLTIEVEGKTYEYEEEDENENQTGDDGEPI
jgi:dCMP deaminase